MKKYFILFLILLGFFVPITCIHASDDTAFTTTRLNKFGSVILRAGNLFRFDIAGFVMPYFTKPQEIAAPDFEPANDFTTKINQRIFPQNILDKGKVIPWTEEITFKSLYGAILKTDQEYSNHPPPTDCFISVTQQVSEPVPFAPSLFQNLESIDAFWGLMPKKTEGDGILNFNRPNTGLGGMNPAEDCKRHDVGVALPDVESDTPKLASFNGDATIVGEIIQTVMEWVTEIINGISETFQRVAEGQHKDDVILTEKKRMPWFSFLCHVYRCPGNELGADTAELDKKGGFTNAFFSPEHQIYVVPAGVHTIDVSVAGFKQRPLEASYDNENQADFGLRRLGCIAAPDGMQEKLSVGKTRPIAELCNPPPKLDCPIDVIKEKAKKPNDNKCTISNAGAAGNFMSNEQKSAYGSGLSPLGVKVLETAADAYKVPASVLLATMLHEGAFNHGGVWDWSDDKKIEEYSDCNNPMPIPSCVAFALSSTGSKAPFGWIDSRWDPYMENNKNPYDGKYFKVELEGLDEVLKGMDSKRFNSCNFADAAFMAARAMSEDFSHAFTAVPAMCIAPAPYGSFPMYTGNLRPESCSSWEADRVGTTRFQYGGGASIGTCTAANPSESYNVGHVIDMWETLTP